MLDHIKLEELVQQIPWAHVALTTALFFATIVVGKLLKSSVKRQSSLKQITERSFWNRFWLSEQKFIMKSIGWLLWLIFVATAIYIWSGHLAKLFLRIEHLYAPLMRAGVIIIVASIALKAANRFISFVIEQVTPLTERRTIRGKQRAETLHQVFKYGASILIVLISSLMLMSTFGIDLKALLATVGVASLAVGFGAQSLVKDVVSGIFILIEDQYAVGDVVVINGEGGFVENMTLRITQMRNTEGTLISIPNGQVTMVKNLTSEWSRVDYMIGVAYETDLDHAIAVIMDEAQKLKNDMPDKITADPELKGVDEFNDSSIIIRVWIRTAPLMQWDVKRELNRRIHKRFDEEGITIPFPQRTVWIKEPSVHPTPPPDGF